MEYGFVLPKLINHDDLLKFSESAETLGFHSIWASDHVVLPIEETSLYPYTDDGRFTANAEDPQLDALILLSFLSSHTQKIKMGTSVLIAPYRNPILQAKMLASLDVLSNGRLICGLGVGWWKEEFAALQAPFENRGVATDEYIQIFKTLWEDNKPKFNGETYNFSDIAFFPKPVQEPNGIPIWVGGHTKRAIRRTVKYGDAWHPTRLTPLKIKEMKPYLSEQCQIHERDINEITISLKRTLHFTDIDIPTNSKSRSQSALIDNTQTVIEDIKECSEVGIQQLTFDFQTGNLEDCTKIMEHLANIDANLVL